MFDLKVFIGKAVKLIRQQKGMTQAELAYEIGRVESAVKSLENKGGCSIPKLDLIADALDTRASYLIYLAEEMREEAYLELKGWPND